MNSERIKRGQQPLVVRVYRRTMWQCGGCLSGELNYPTIPRETGLTKLPAAHHSILADAEPSNPAANRATSNQWIVASTLRIPVPTIPAAPLVRNQSLRDIESSRSFDIGCILLTFSFDVFELCYFNV